MDACDVELGDARIGLQGQGSDRAKKRELVAKDRRRVDSCPNDQGDTNHGREGKGRAA